MPIRKNAHLTIGATDISANCLQIDVSENIATNPATTMGSNTEKVEAGLNDWKISVQIEGNQNGRGTSEVALHSILRTAAKTGAVIYRNDAGAKAATNAEWTGTGLFQPLTFAGTSGDKIIWAFDIMPASALTRATA